MKDPIFIDSPGNIDFYAGAVRVELVTYEDIAYAGKKTPRTAPCGHLVMSLDGFRALQTRINAFAEQLKQHGLLADTTESAQTTTADGSPNFPDEQQ